MIVPILIACASLCGAAGVILLAAAAHAAPGAHLDTAGSVLLFHAAAVIAVLAAVHPGLIERRLGTAAAAGLLVGAALFAADIALLAFARHRLFPMAAPTGGTIMILSWLALAAAALMRVWPR